jgi:hypothetical protein
MGNFLRQDIPNLVSPLIDPNIIHLRPDIEGTIHDTDDGANFITTAI